MATTGVQEYAVSDGTGARVVRLDAAPLPTCLGTLGMTGLTAYSGLLEVGRAKAGETVVEGGVRAFPQALLTLFVGENVGKLVLRI